jgi:hypothetical protein
MEAQGEHGMENRRSTRGTPHPAARQLRQSLRAMLMPTTFSGQQRPIRIEGKPRKTFHQGSTPSLDTFGARSPPSASRGAAAGSNGLKTAP